MGTTVQMVTKLDQNVELNVELVIVTITEKKSLVYPVPFGQAKIKNVSQFLKAVP